MNEHMPSRDSLSRVFAIAGLLFFLAAGRSAVYELFIESPGIHVPRVQIDQTQFAPHVSFYLDTPILAWFMVLGGCFVGGFGAIMLLWQPRQKKYLISLIVGFITVIFGFVLSLNNFFSSAGDF